MEDEYETKWNLFVDTCELRPFQKEWCVRGYHMYQEWWEAVVGDELECQWECCTSCKDCV